MKKMVDTEVNIKYDQRTVNRGLTPMSKKSRKAKRAYDKEFKLEIKRLKKMVEERKRKEKEEEEEL